MSTDALAGVDGEEAEGPSMLVRIVLMVPTMLVATGMRPSTVGMFIVDREETRF